MLLCPVLRADWCERNRSLLQAHSLAALAQPAHPNDNRPVGCSGCQQTATGPARTAVPTPRHALQGPNIRRHALRENRMAPWANAGELTGTAGPATLALLPRHMQRVLVRGGRLARGTGTACACELHTVADRRFDATHR